LVSVPNLHPIPSLRSQSVSVQWSTDEPTAGSIYADGGVQKVCSPHAVHQVFSSDIA
jgi:hypothetical protein